MARGSHAVAEGGRTKTCKCDHARVAEVSIRFLLLHEDTRGIHSHSREEVTDARRRRETYRVVCFRGGDAADTRDERTPSAFPVAAVASAPDFLAVASSCHRRSWRAGCTLRLPRRSRRNSTRTRGTRVTRAARSRSHPYSRARSILNNISRGLRGHAFPRVNAYARTSCSV
ncbi:hypothetical protein PUN28_014782 [Cardiocondyla obscurior]|uniref:Uncharacterized protein n=1 Tax=Cardiocondyla obscurior TaxID=286306 RepID=A0AAW2F0G4_9HYME